MQISNFTLEIDTKMRFLFIAISIIFSLTRAGQKNRHPKENAYVRNLKTTKREKKLAFLFFFLQTLVC